MSFISNSQIIGTIFSWLRAQKNIDQITFAKKMKLTQASLSRIENGKAIMNIEQVLFASNILEIESSYVLILFTKLKELLENQGFVIVNSRDTINGRNISFEPITIVRGVLTQHVLSIMNKI
ncbi:helix-turn-helix domain-containing protein [Sulfurospirillum oryzae]|uniref:helix-turn-helix domain-containing protein n=1 Tax=Sulfurospirillum oryzae TaxID=2976535 RepID=UPI0021E785C6|nr:helix-turn-helix transcriptional regulator [Sulfurospirillum oryzae]